MMSRPNDLCESTMTRRLRVKTVIAALFFLSATACYRFRSPCDGPDIDTPVGESAEPFSSTEGRFVFGLPATRVSPVDSKGATEQQDKLVRFKWFVLNQGQYEVTYLDSDRELEKSENNRVIFDKLRDSVLAKEPGQLEVDKDLELSGHPGREVRIRDDRGLTIMRFYLAGQRLYTVSVFVPRRLDCAMDGVEQILDSFKLIDEKSVN